MLTMRHLSFLLFSIFSISSALQLEKRPKGLQRRAVLTNTVVAFIASNSFCISVHNKPAIANDGSGPYILDSWTGTSLQVRSIDEAAKFALTNDIVNQFPMARWPDPILRRPAQPISATLFGTEKLRVVAQSLRKTARAEGAVGLAAQQCGVDGRIVWIDTAAADSTGNKKKRSKHDFMTISGEGTGEIAKQPIQEDEGGLFLINPRITSRSPEISMIAWTETCLVLPPSFKATVLRDSSITVEFENFDGATKSITLEGELARCVQHEMDHDRGILITDHVGFEEMEGGSSGLMAQIEKKGHENRMAIAYGRDVSKTTVHNLLSTATIDHPLLQPASAADMPDMVESFLASSSSRSTNQSQIQKREEECDEACRDRRKKIIEERRAMLRQSRSTSSREEIFELSRQRAKLYGTEYKGATCPQGIPCL